MDRGAVFLVFLAGMVAGSVFSRLFQANRDRRAALRNLRAALRAIVWLVVLVAVGVAVAVGALRSAESSGPRPQPSSTTQR